MPGHVIGAKRSGKLCVSHDSHDLEKVHVAFIRENLRKVMQSSADVAHVNLINFSSLAQILDNRQNLCLWVLQPLSCRSQTQLKSVVRTINDGLVSFDRLKNRWRIPVIGA